MQSRSGILGARRVRREVGRVAFWYHSIDLGNSVVTPGAKSAEFLADEWKWLGIPNLTGKTVLDVGAWDGYFSFEAERHGAARVVALDHFVWSLDTKLSHEYRDRCVAEGREPQHFQDLPSMWRPDELPGKRGFDVAHRALGSRVESRIVDFMELDLDELGQFDVVFYLGVLYHMRHPLAALERVFRVTREVAIIETQGMVVPGYEDFALCEFFPGAAMADDPTNWWRPNAAALVALCRAAGFGRVEVTTGGVPEASVRPGAPNPCAYSVRAWRSAAG